MNQQMKQGIGAPTPEPKSITGAVNQSKSATNECLNVAGSVLPDVKPGHNPNKIENSRTYSDEKS